MTIRGRLYLLSFVVLFVIAVMGGFAYYRGDAILSSLMDEAGMEIIKGAAQTIDGKLDRIEGVLLTAAEAIRDSMTRRAPPAEKRWNK